MMYTAKDRDEVKEAILKLIAGKRVVKVSFSGLNGTIHTTEYSQAGLPDLQRLLHEIESQLNPSEEDWYCEQLYSRKF